jgi:hypothetical protein
LPTESLIIPADLNESYGKQTLEYRDCIHPTNERRTETPITSWDNYISNIPKWDWILSSKDVITILNDDNAEISIVSDGGCYRSFGSFGWVISNKLNIMIEGHGSVPGAPMSSHRAEGFGKLSWVTLLHHITLYFGVTIRCTIRSYCDNKAIVQTTKTQMTYSSLSLAVCPNYDILRTIATKQQQLMSSTIKFENTMYVKAHQDQKKPFHALTTEEKLNVRADEIATMALHRAKEEKDTPNYILPLGMAFLCMDGAAQSSEEQRTLRWRLSEFKLQEYYSEKFNIKITKLATINWAALRLAREKLHPGQRSFTIKHTIEWLATGNRMQMQGQILNSCPLCGNEENTDHLYLCSQRTEKAKSTSDTFKKFLKEIKTDKVIISAMVWGFQRWVVANNTHQMPEDPDMSWTDDHEVSRAVNSQDEIGWHLLVSGILAFRWSEIQESRSENISNPTGDIWGSKVCLWWIQQSHELWIQRNKELHETVNDKDTWKDKEVREQVKNLYASAMDISADDRVIFHVPLNERLTQTTSSLQTWVHNMEPIIKACKINYEDRIRNQNSDIRSYFQEQTTTVSNDTTNDKSPPNTQNDGSPLTKNLVTNQPVTNQPVTNHQPIMRE